MTEQTELLPKTLEEHREYLHGIVKLKLFFLHVYLTEYGTGETFSEAIRNRVDIYRKTDANPGPLTPQELFFDAPAWKNMEDEAAAIFERYRSIDDRAKFEEEAFRVFQGSIDRRCERDYLDPSVLANYQCGSLKHDPALREDGCLGFHMANAVRPHSFYDDPLYLPRCFRALLRVAELQYHAKGIYTHSWLNSTSRWCAQFPGVWMENMSEPNPQVNWSYGVWGQFISARGTLQKNNADYLREHKKMRYPARGSFVPLDIMKEHIQKILGD